MSYEDLERRLNFSRSSASWMRASRWASKRSLSWEGDTAEKVSSGEVG